MQQIIKKYAKFLDYKKPQTTKKIEFVTNYVKNWLMVMANASTIDSINFIDCMCNAGIYKDGDLGTSSEVFKLFAESAVLFPDKTFNLYLNDYNNTRIEITKEVINKISTQIPLNLHVNYSVSDANDYLNNLYTNDEIFGYGKATILFVDPYDFGTIHIPTLKRLCSKHYFELLFNLFTSDWVRNKNNDLDNRIDKVIDNPDAVFYTKDELVWYIVDELKIGFMQHSFNYAFRIETNAELYQIVYLTPKLKGLEKLKESLWETFNGSSYYRNPAKVQVGQMSLFTPEIEEQLAQSTEAYIIQSNVDLAKDLLRWVPNKKHVSYAEIEQIILEGTMLKKTHLINHIIKPFMKEGILIKLNEGVIKSNYTADYYDIKG